jgi:hypothetical protein
MGNSHRGFESHALRMGRLVYSVIASLDGYVNDTDGRFGWAEPDPQVHGYVNDVMRPVGTHLYGRRLYEVMAGWQTMGTSPEEPTVTRDFGELWRAADKVVYSTTLTDVPTPRTRLERRFDADAVRRLVSDSQWWWFRSSSAVARRPCRTASVWDWSSSTSAASTAVSSRCATASDGKQAMCMRGDSMAWWLRRSPW